MAQRGTTGRGLMSFLWPIAFLVFLYLAYKLGWLEWLANVISRYVTDGIANSTANITITP